MGKSPPTYKDDGERGTVPDTTVGLGPSAHPDDERPTHRSLVRELERLGVSGRIYSSDINYFHLYEFNDGPSIFRESFKLSILVTPFTITVDVLLLLLRGD